VNFTASASNGSPLWNWIPRRSLNSHAVARRGLLVVLRVERGRIDALRDHHRARGRGVGEQGQRDDERGQDDADAVWGHGHALQGARSETTRV